MQIEAKLHTSMKSNPNGYGMDASPISVQSAHHCAELADVNLRDLTSDQVEQMRDRVAEILKDIGKRANAELDILGDTVADREAKERREVVAEKRKAQSAPKPSEF